MEPDTVAAFCEAYTEERNRLAAALTQNRDGLERELSSVRRDHAKLVDAIIAGVPADQVKNRMIALDMLRQEIEDQLARSDAQSPVRFHPTMAGTYQERVADLIRNLGNLNGAEEAREAVRALVDKIVLMADPEGRVLNVDLHGALAALLRLATGAPAHLLASGPHQQKTSDELY